MNRISGQSVRFLKFCNASNSQNRSVSVTFVKMGKIADGASKCEAMHHGKRLKLIIIKMR
jgi:hypothetical protein